MSSLAEAGGSMRASLGAPLPFRGHPVIFYALGVSPGREIHAKMAAQSENVRFIEPPHFFEPIPGFFLRTHLQLTPEKIFIYDSKALTRQTFRHIGRWLFMKDLRNIHDSMAPHCERQVRLRA